ncbi:sodium- and chloride-dependent glycine transporter 2-like [Scylla paramamosain]|uniref:sodium- and chloride-dependent glycine transporter 2-like n=1 Tax=Scylla paramamosain TaxID=85552 RepID=UPI0030839072
MGQDENKHRGNWASSKDYFLSLAGYAVGLGNMWRFPYLCYRNGGGAFLIPYLIMVSLVGVPLFFLESSVGQFTSSGLLTLYSVAPMFRGVGYAKMLVNLLASGYYGMVVAYPLVFLVYSFATTVPWSSCDNYWNTAHCFIPGESEESRLTLLDKLNASNLMQGDDNLVFPADEFFHYKILGLSEGIHEPGALVWSLVGASAIVWGVTFLSIFKGVKVLGKVVWFTATFPLLMLVVLFLRGVTLPGAINGISYYIVPNFSKLGEPMVWCDAAVQVFFSLGTGWGTVPTMASFNRFKNNCLRDALLVPLVNSFASIFAGFVVFSVLGFLSMAMGVSVEDVTTAGPALAFVTYPQALALLPLPSMWSVLFFLMLFFLGIDSAFVQMEATVVSIIDAFPNLRPRRGWVSLSVCASIFVTSLACCTQGGFYVLQLLDRYSVSLSLLTAAICELAVFSYVYGSGRLIRDFEMMLGRKLSVFWYCMWVVVTPLILVSIFGSAVSVDSELVYKGYFYPAWTQVVGWGTAVIPLLAIPTYAIYYLLTTKGSFFQRVWSGVNPSLVWGPALEHHREEWIDYCACNPLLHRYFHRDFDCRHKQTVAVVNSGELSPMETKSV